MHFWKNSSIHERIASLLLISGILLCATIYSSGLQSIFVLDDAPNIGLTKIDSLNVENITQVIASNQSGVHPLSRAIPTISFSLTNLQYLDDVSGYKYHNLLLHLLCGIFVFLFIYKLHQAFSNDKNKSAYVALLTSTIWLLHPLLVSTTLYSVQRITQFATLFTLITLCVALHAKQTNNNIGKITLYYIIFPIFLILGLMSKETSALIPLYIIAIGYALRGSEITPTTLVDKSFFFIFGVITTSIGAIVFLFKSERFLNYSNRNFDLYERLLSQPQVVVGYIKNIVLPKLSSMGLYVDDAIIQKNIDALTLLNIFILVSIFTFACYCLHQKKFSGILAIYFLGHILESSIFPLELAFEHRNHFPSIGIIAFISYVILSIKKDSLKIIASLLIVTLYASILSIRVDFWSNEHEWQKTSIAFHPKSVRANITYTNYLSKYFGNTAAYAHILKAQKAIPESNILKIVQLTFLCGDDADNLELSRNVIQAIDKNLQSHDLQIAETAVLLQLSEKISIVRCSNIDTESYFSFIHQLIQTRERADLNVGNLYAVRGLLLHASGRNEDASDNFKLAYLTTHKAGHMLAAIKTLLIDKNSFDKALKVVEDINNGKYFNTTHYAKLARRANDIVNTSRFATQSSIDYLKKTQ